MALRRKRVGDIPVGIHDKGGECDVVGNESIDLECLNIDLRTFSNACEFSSFSAFFCLLLISFSSFSRSLADA